MKTLTDNTSRIISEMADEMLRLGEGCTRDQLALRYTAEDIDLYGEQARTLANIRAVRERRSRRAA